MSELKKQILNHERNRYISFDEDKHEYMYFPSGDKRKTSEAKQFFGVTSWMSEFLPPFPKDQHIKSANNPNSPYYGWDPEDVKQAWLDKRDYGSDGHKAIELSINDGLYDDEWGNYIDKAWELLEEAGITPVFAEWVVFDEDVDRASAIDICGDKDGKLVIVDMKFFSDGMKYTAYKNETFNVPLQAIPSSKFDMVSLQTSIYSKILQKKYPDVPLSDERYVMLFTEEGAELLPTINYDDQVDLLYDFAKEIAA